MFQRLLRKTDKNVEPHAENGVKFFLGGTHVYRLQFRAKSYLVTTAWDF
jgi:hypothetical protein